MVSRATLDPDAIASALIEALERWQPQTSFAGEGDLRLAVYDALDHELDKVMVADGHQIRILCEGVTKMARFRLFPCTFSGDHFWPDITVVREDGCTPLLAVELKLLTKGPTAFATAVGQAVFYRYGKPFVGHGKRRLADGMAYPRTVAFVVDQRPDASTMEDTPDADEALQRLLKSIDVTLIVRRPNSALKPAAR